MGRGRRIAYIMMIVLSLIALIFSILIELEKKSGNETAGAICNALSGPQGCATVQQSNYSHIFGFDNPILGMVGFSAMILLCVIQLRRNDGFSRTLIIAGSFFSGLLSLWFLYVQRFILHSYCGLCLVVDSSSIILLGIGIYLLAKEVRKRPVTVL